MSIAFSAVSYKEWLAEGVANALYAFVSLGRADCIAEYVHKAGNIFSCFISGQVLEVFILGAMVMVGMLVCGFPNVLAISSLVMLVAFIPVVGAWISAMVRAIMIFALRESAKRWALFL